MRKIFSTLLLLVLLGAQAQNVETSYNKIIENGKEYYLYEVQESEGFMAIARKFGVAYQDIIELNKDVTKEGLKVKQILRIPVVDGRNANPSDIKSSDFVYHKVNAGETLFFISRLYKVSINDIVTNNPGSENVLSQGQELRIPKKSTITTAAPVRTVAPQQAQAIEEDSEFYYHTVQPKETAYGIARKYNIHISELAKNNPGLETNNLKLGIKVRIPKNTEVKAENTTTNNLSDKRYLYHRIKNDETLESIAAQYKIPANIIIENNTFGQNLPSAGYMIKIPHSYESLVKNEKKTNTYVVKKNDDIRDIAVKYDVPIMDIKAANPKVNKWTKLKKGIELIIPTYEIENISTAKNKITEEQIEIEQFFTKERKSMGDTIEVAFVWPLFLERNDTINNIKKFNPATKETSYTTREIKTIYPASTMMFREFYFGALMAINELKEQGVTIKLKHYDTEQSAASIIRTLNKKSLLNADIIFGPAFQNHLKPISDYCQTNQIRLVVPYISENAYLANNPYLYQIFPNTEIEQTYISKKVVERYNHNNIIVIKSKTNDTRQSVFTEKIKTELYSPQNLGFNQISYNEVDFNRNNIGDITALLSHEKENIIVIPDKKEKNYTRIIPILENYLSKNKNVKIKILGFSEYQFFELSELESLFNVGCELYSPLYADMNSQDVNLQMFKVKYTNYFDCLPTHTYPYYSLLGYDAVTYFISGLDEYGNNLENNLDKIKYNHLCVDFDFQRINNWGGFINKTMYGVEYTNDYNIQKIE